MAERRSLWVYGPIGLDVDVDIEYSDLLRGVYLDRPPRTAPPVSSPKLPRPKVPETGVYNLAERTKVVELAGIEQLVDPESRVRALENAGEPDATLGYGLLITVDAASQLRAETFEAVLDFAELTDEELIALYIRSLGG